MSDKTMAVVAPMPVTTHVQNSFSHRCHSPGSSRRNAGHATNTTAPVTPVGRTNSGTPTRRQPITSLENIAAQLEFTLNTSPSADFGYRDGHLYGESRPRVVPLFKSKSLPNFSRNIQSSTSPKAPLRKAKSVRFADSQGLPLVEAVHQLTVRDSSYTANKIVPYDDQEDLLGALPLMVSAPEEVKASLQRSSTVPVSLPSCNSPQTSTRRQNSPVHKHTFTFTQPSYEPDFFQRVKREYVVLESIREESRSLHGIVRVFNLAYSKEVTVRWTHDGWRTSHDTSAVFCSNDGDTDRFAFELPINGDDVSFAVRFRVEGGEYWDNNRGTNYTVTSRP